MGKNLLIIGNGFDLAQGLPTSYRDFMEFAEAFRYIYTLDNNARVEEYEGKLRYFDNKENGNYGQIKEQLLTLMASRKAGKAIDGHWNSGCTLSDISSLLDRMNVDLNDNIWFGYFEELMTIQKDSQKFRFGSYSSGNSIPGERWVDFEKEILYIIRWLDSQGLKDDDNVSDISIDQMTLRTEIFKRSVEKNTINELEADTLIAEFVNVLYKHLRNFTEALEIYLGYFVARLSCDKDGPGIGVMPDYILSFNYTRNIEKFFTGVEICYVHGKCRAESDYDRRESDLVLGINEYLPDDKKDTVNVYAIFKKFIQRIRNNNDTTYYKWALAMKDLYENKHEVSDVWVYGHSLDVTDGDILERFLKPEYTSVHIFTREKEPTEAGRLAKNLISIMSEDVMIEKSSSDSKRLKFITLPLTVTEQTQME